MKNFVRLCIFFLIFCFQAFSQNSNSEFSKLSFYIESGVIPIKSQNTSTLNCYQGELALEYNLLSKFHIGIFGQTIFYHQNLDLANIENKIIEMSSIEYNSLGINMGYKFQFSKIILLPKLDFSYNFFLAKSLDYIINKNDFLDYRYLSFTPKINLGYAFTDGFFLGFNLGYNSQLTTLKGRKIDEFNPNSFQIGFFSSFPIKKF